MCWTDEVTLPCPDPAAAASARRFCAEGLIRALGRQVESDEVAEDVALVTSELVANAINADCINAVVRMEVHRRQVRMSVADDGAGVPVPQNPSPMEGHGRGLMIVAGLSRAWGVTPTPTGKEVWAEVALPERLTAGLRCDSAGEPA